jgi:hypothetical protein
MEHVDADTARSRRWLGRGLFVATPLVGAAIWFAGLWLYASMGWPPDWNGWVMGIALIVCSILIALGKRLSSPGAKKALAEDRRAPVLLLRSFTQDRTSLFAADTLEAHLAAALREIGPVIAVGRPHEGLPPEGADRIYYQDEEWRRRVELDMSRAQVLVIRVGTTPNLLWEIRAAFCVATPERTLLVLPESANLDDLLLDLLLLRRKRTASRVEAYAEFRNLLLGVLPNPLPESIGNALFVAFDAEWRPHLLRPARWKPYNLSHVVRTRETIRPWCESLGITLRRRRTFGAAIGYSLLLGSMALAALLVLTIMALSS